MKITQHLRGISISSVFLRVYRSEHRVSILFPLLCLNIAMWFRGTKPIGFGDTGLFYFFLHPGYSIKSFQFIWSANDLAGHSAPQHVSVLPTAAFFALLQSFGLSPFLRQAIWFWSIELIAMMSMYWLLVRLLRGQPRRVLVAFLAAVLYVLSPVTMVNFWYNGDLSIVVILFLPLVFLTIDIAFERNVIASAVLGGATLLLGSLAFSNPAFVIPVLIVGVVFALYRIFSIARENSMLFVLKHVGMAIAAAFLACLLNIWWLLPMVHGANSYYQSSLAQLNGLSTLKEASQQTNLDTLLHMFPYAVNAPLWAYKNPGWRFTYANWLMTLLSLLLFVFVAWSLARRPWRKSTGLFLFIALTGMIMSLGLNSPFGAVFRWLFLHVPFFQAFRSPVNKFVILYDFGVAVLVAIGAAELAELARGIGMLKLRRVGIAAFVIIFAGIYVYPMWTGAVVDGSITIRGNPVTSNVAIPDSYDKVARFFAQHHSPFGVLTLPLSRNGYTTLTWKNGYDGPDSTWLLLQHPAISFGAVGFAGANMLIRALDKHSLRDAVAIAGRMGCSFIVVQGDVATKAIGMSFTPPETPSKITDILSSLGLKAVLVSGHLTVFAIPMSLRSPMLYATTEVLPLPVGNQLIASLSSQHFGSSLPVFVSPNSALTFEDNQKQRSREWISNVATAPFQIEEKNPTRWLFRVSRVPSHFIVVLNQSFSTGWQGTVKWQISSTSKGVISSQLTLPLTKHMEANGFANAWDIRTPPGKKVTQATIVLSYEPQQLVSVGENISVITGIVIAILAIFQVSSYLRGRNEQ